MVRPVLIVFIVGMSLLGYGFVHSVRQRRMVHELQQYLLQPDSAATTNYTNVANETLEQQNQKLEDEEAKAIEETLGLEEKLAEKQYEEESGEPSVPDGPITPTLAEGHGSTPPESSESMQHDENDKKRRKELDKLQQELQQVDSNETAKIQEKQSEINHLEAREKEEILEAEGLTPQQAKEITNSTFTVTRKK